MQTRTLAGVTFPLRWQHFGCGELPNRREPQANCGPAWVENPPPPHPLNGYIHVCYYYNERCVHYARPRSGLDGRGQQRGFGANRFVHVHDPAFRPRTVTGLRRRVAAMVVGDVLQHALQGVRWQGQQDAEQQTDLRQRQQRDFFNRCCSRTRKKWASATRVI